MAHTLNFDNSQGYHKLVKIIEGPRDNDLWEVRQKSTTEILVSLAGCWRKYVVIEWLHNSKCKAVMVGEKLGKRWEK